MPGSAERPDDTVDRERRAAGAGLTAADLFRIVLPREPRISPDGRSLLYLREQADIHTDTIRRRLRWIDRQGARDRAVETAGAVVAARWLDSRTAIVVEAADGAGALVSTIRLESGDRSVLAHLPAPPSQIDLSRDGRRLALLMKMPFPVRTAQLPPKPADADWSPRARYIDRTVWQVDGVGELDGADQLFVLDLEDGTLAQKTDALKAGGLFPSGISWSADGNHIYFSANLTDDPPAGQWNADLHALDVADGGLTSLTGGPGGDVDPRPSPDGRWIAYRGFTDRGQFHHDYALRLIRSDGTEARTLVDIGANIGSHAWSADGAGLVFSFVRDGALHLAHASLDGVVTALADTLAPDGTFDVEPYLYGSGDFDVDAQGVVAVVADAADPGQIAAIDLSGAQTTLTQLNTDWLAEVALGKVEPTAFDGADGTPLNGWILYPPGYDAQTPCPLILNIHGGPNLAYGRHFSFRFQRYAAEGYIVLLVNYRGSAGGDMRFYEEPSRFPSAEFDDLIAGVDHAIARACVDRDRLYVTGLSAGGVLTAWTIGKTTRFAAAAVHSPIVNWLSHSLTCDLYSSYTSRSFAVAPWEDPMAYWRRSPLSLVADVRTPTLVIHGERDSRTPKSEGTQFYHALKMLGVPAAMVLLPDAFHIPTRPTQWIEEQHFILDWFARYAKSEPRP